MEDWRNGHPQVTDRAETSLVDYSSLPTGYRVPEITFEADRRMVEAYRRAVGEFMPADNVPPMAVAAAAMGALSRILGFPLGAIHVFQELDFRLAVKPGESLTCLGTLLRRRIRRGFHLLTFGISVLDAGRRNVLSGKTGMLLPDAPAGKAASVGEWFE